MPGLRAVLLAAFWRMPDLKEKINELIMTYLPYFVFIMYAINRGTGFTRALFVNCDHSLLTYSFYKQPGAILRLFQIRLREIIKINLLPAAVIGAGLAVLLYASGGTDNPLNYGVLLVSILCMSVLFLCALSDDLLSAAALQCRDRDQKRHLSAGADGDLCSLLPVYEASDADSAVWRDDDPVLCTLLYSGLCSGLPVRPPDVPDTGVVKCNRLNLHQPVVHFFTHAFFCLSTPFDTGELVIIDDKPAVFTGHLSITGKIFQSYARTAGIFFLPR